MMQMQNRVVMPIKTSKYFWNLVVKLSHFNFKTPRLLDQPNILDSIGAGKLVELFVCHDYGGNVPLPE